MGEISVERVRDEYHVTVALCAKLAGCRAPQPASCKFSYSSYIMPLNVLNLQDSGRYAPDPKMDENSNKTSIFG